MTCAEFRRTLWDRFDAGLARPAGHAAACPSCSLYAAQAARLHAALPAAFEPCTAPRLGDAVLARLGAGRPDAAGRPIAAGAAAAAALAWAAAAWLGWPSPALPEFADPLSLEVVRAAWGLWLAVAAAAPSVWVWGLLAASSVLSAALLRDAADEAAGRQSWGRHWSS